MTISPDDLAGRAGPTYRALADALTEAVQEGRLSPGAQLPPQRDLAYRLGITVGTVGRAYDLLGQRGMTRGEVGRGTYVLERQPAMPVEKAVSADVDGLIDLTSNFPAPVPAQAKLGELLPIAESAVTVLAELLRYPDAAGAPRHRAAAAAWLQQLGIPAEPERTLLTNGAEGALAAALIGLARPGDVILAEQLCYSGVRSLVARLGQHLEPVAMDEEGVLPDALRSAARHRGARLLMLSPTLHNPTGILTALPRREALVAVARELDLRIIEDEVYAPLVPRRPPALVCLAPERTLHISSLSKFLAPGLRLGFACGPADMTRAVIGAQHDLSLGYAPLAGELFARAFEAGVLDHALEQQQREMIDRRELATTLLRGLEMQSPRTALHIWLQLPDRWTGAEASLALARAGVLVASAERFFIGRGAVPAAVRISLGAAPTRPHLRSALRRVALVLAPDARGQETGGLI